VPAGLIAAIEIVCVVPWGKPSITAQVACFPLSVIVVRPDIASDLPAGLALME
jgi:hypothetical protein